MMAFKKLVDWSKKEFSYLPWRQDVTLYRVLVSEIMLQQTTVPVVIKYFEPFLEKFPDISALAKATEEDVCLAWKGLGYYRRARHLRHIAIQVVEQHGGKIPSELQVLQSLKGVGPYTASALLAFGENKKTLAIDANVERVLARFYGKLTSKGPKLHRELMLDFNKGMILSEMEKFGPANLHGALMDLGRTFCRANSADCTSCPLSSSCFAHQNKSLTFSLKGEKKEGIELNLLRLVIENADQILLYKKNQKEWLSGQWELPTFVFPSRQLVLFHQYPVFPNDSFSNKFMQLPLVKTNITKYKINNYVSRLNEKEASRVGVLSSNSNSSSGLSSRYQYVLKSDLPKIHLSTATEKVLSLING